MQTFLKIKVVKKKKKTLENSIYFVNECEVAQNTVLRLQTRVGICYLTGKNQEKNLLSVKSGTG